MSDKKPSPEQGAAGLGVSALGIAVLAFIVGAMVTRFETFPYPQLLEAPFEALQAHGEQIQLGTLPKTEANFWAPARTEKTGVTLYKEGEAFDGYTLYTSGHNHGAQLIDMQGNVVHQWEVPFGEAWPDPPHVSSPMDPRFIYWRDAHIFPNGDVLTQYYAAGDTPYGYGMIKVDKDSKILWKYADNAHHDLFVADDNTIWTIGQAFRDTNERPVKGAPQLEPKVLEDFIIQLSPQGEEILRLPVFEALADTPFEHMLSFYTNFRAEDAPWDPLHTNSIEVIGPEFAAHHDFAEPGMVLISIRSMDALVLVDLETRKAVWATRGFWLHQHDPDALPNGRIQLFDNRGHVGHGGGSRVIEFDPKNNAMTWVYAGTEDEYFYSKIRSKQQQLPNGNLLISSHEPGRLFEVTRDKEIVWEFFTPHRHDDGDTEYVAAVSGMMRVPKDYLDFKMSGPQKNGPKANAE